MTAFLSLLSSSIDFIIPYSKITSMRQFLIILFISTLAFSCNNSGKKEKETINKGTATKPSIDSGGHKTVDQFPDKVAENNKTIHLTFSGYEEGDYPHLLFTETGTATVYDFGSPEDNSLDNTDVVIKDSKASFGYKENSKMKGVKFIADIVYRSVDTYDENGQPKKGFEWRITGLRKDE